MAYDFYLDKCLLPVSPEKLEIKINNSNETITLINDGEINVLKTPELTDIEFECDLPQVSYPYARYTDGFQDAAYYLDYFEELKTSKEPFQFIVSRERPDGTVLFSTDITVSMESYTLTENASNAFDVSVKIKLKQYRDYGTKTVSVDISTSKAKTSNTRSSSTTKSTSSKSQTYTVKSGDCLWNIAKKYYGDGSKYTIIYNANKSVIGSNPNLIYPGQVLTIPAA